MLVIFTIIVIVIIFIQYLLVSTVHEHAFSWEDCKTPGTVEQKVKKAAEENEKRL